MQPSQLRLRFQANETLYALALPTDIQCAPRLPSIAGLNFVARQAAETGRPTIASMSLGGGASRALDNAVNSVCIHQRISCLNFSNVFLFLLQLTQAGVHVTVAAGNNNEDAANTSPARVLSAITVGASTIADQRASFSNFGSVVDVFAPGLSITSSWIGSSNAETRTISGTSMSTPHVAGLVAYLISVNGNVAPDAMQELVKSLSVKDALTGLRKSHRYSPHSTRTVHTEQLHSLWHCQRSC